MALVVTTIIGVGAPSALAASHPFLSSFGSFAEPNGIAIDEAGGDVYVAALGTDTIYKVDASGAPVEFSALHSNALTGAGTPAGSFSFPTSAPGTPAAIAVDNSTNPADPSAGDLYVMDAGHDVIDKFSSTGRYEGQIAGPFSGPLRGLGIGAGGSVRVYTASHPPAVDVFDDSTTNDFVEPLETRATGAASADLPEYGSATGEQNGDDYLLFACGCIEKFGGNLEQLGRVDSGPADVATAVDPATGHLYVDDGSSVQEWDTGGMNGSLMSPHSAEDEGSGALVSSFGEPRLTSSSSDGGIGVNGASGNIYVADPGKGEVDVFSTAGPAAAAGQATNTAATSATLHGTVNPRGGAISRCEFEYAPGIPSKLAVPVTEFSEKSPCAQGAGEIGSGTKPVPVSAVVGGLQPGLLYHFRLVAEDAAGVSTSSGLFASGGPGMGIKVFELAFVNQDGTPDVQAGSHPFEMKTNIAFNTMVIPRETTADSRYVTQPDGNVQQIVVDLPPGLIGDPNATGAKCTLEQLETARGENNGGGHCPAESEIGRLEVEFGEDSSPAIREPVYNMQPPRGVAVQIGANFIVPKSYIDVGVQAGGDYPVQATSLGIPAIEPITAIRLGISGVVGTGENRKAFLTLPTSCAGPLRATVSASSYQEPGNVVKGESITRNAAGEPVGLTGCAQLEFPPTITVTPDTTDASTASGLTVGVHVSQKAALNPQGLAESALRDTTVRLPEGVQINPAGADGLQACSQGLAGFEGFAEFNREFEPGERTPTFIPDPPEKLQPGVNLCPDSSKIGTVKLKTPLLTNPLEGAVYLATQEANPFGSLLALYMFIEDPISGTTVKLTGEVRLCEGAGEVVSGVSCQAAGQIVTSFTNTPELPFEELELHFFGGERAPLSTPSRCKSYTTTAVFTPWDGNAPVTTGSSFAIDHGPNGAPCPGASLPFDPSLTAGTTSNQAGGSSAFTTTMSRDDGDQDLQSIRMRLPAGLSGVLTGVKLCGEAEADAGTCGPESLIGETIVSVGVGNDPFTVTGGRVYLTGPYRGAPFGLSIVNPAKAGPYDLGQVIVRAKVEVDPTTAELTVTTDNEGPYRIPTMIDGIPLQIRHVNVTVDRRNFTFNPTDCNPLAVTGTIASTEGASSTVAVPFQATNCARLAFKPSFTVATSAHTSRTNGASLDVRLSYPKAPFGTQANIAKVKVELPKQLPSRLTTLQKACRDSTFEADPAGCPAASRIGSATAITPILPVPLAGPAYFVSHGGAKFPELVVVLQGYGTTIELHGETFINKAGITSSSFNTVPDVPVGSFELRLPEGTDSALAANGDLCAEKLVMPTSFKAQNGAEIKEKVPISVQGCRPEIRVLRHRVQGKRATVVVSVPSAGTLLAGGNGLARVSKQVRRAGVVTVTLRLSAADQRFVARHHNRRLEAPIRLSFRPSHGRRLEAQVAVLMR